MARKEALLDARNFEGKWLVYRRASKRLSFMGKPKDTKAFLTVGMVAGGAVSGKPVAYWLDKIAKGGRVP